MENETLMLRKKELEAEFDATLVALNKAIAESTLGVAPPFSLEKFKAEHRNMSDILTELYNVEKILAGETLPA